MRKFAEHQDRAIADRMTLKHAQPSFSVYPQHRIEQDCSMSEYVAQVFEQDGILSEEVLWKENLTTRVCPNPTRETSYRH